MILKYYESRIPKLSIHCTVYLGMQKESNTRRDIRSRSIDTIRYRWFKIVLEIYRWILMICGQANRQVQQLVHLKIVQNKSLNFKSQEIWPGDSKNLEVTYLLQKRLSNFYPISFYPLAMYCSTHRLVTRGKSLLELWVTTFIPDWQPPFIFVRFISNFLCMCSYIMASAHVILK